MKIKAVIFDVGSVLQLSRKQNKRYSGVHEYIADKLDVALDTWFDAIDTPYGKSFIGELDDKKVISIISDNLEISEKKLVKTYMDAMKKHFRKNEELYKIASKLKKKGYIIGVLSDQWTLSSGFLIPKKDRRIFDVVIVSNEVGIRKPNIKIYKLLMSHLRKKKKGLKTSEVLFIDNRDYNLKPARKLGMKVILFKDNGQVVREMRKMGVL